MSTSTGAAVIVASLFVLILDIGHPAELRAFVFYAEVCVCVSCVFWLYDYVCVCILFVNEIFPVHLVAITYVSLFYSILASKAPSCSSFPQYPFSIDLLCLMYEFPACIVPSAAIQVIGFVFLPYTVIESNLSLAVSVHMGFTSYWHSNCCV